MKYVNLCVCLFVVVCWMLGGIGADAAEDVLVVFGGAYPPFQMDGLERGMIIDFFNAFETHYPEFHFIRKQLPRKRLDLMLEQGNAQVHALNSPLFVNHAQAEQSIFTEPLWTTGDYVIMKRGNAFEYHAPQDLFGKKIGVILGFKYGHLDAYIESGKIEAYAVRSSRQLYRMLLHERVDAIIGNRHVVPYEMECEGLDVGQMVFADTPLYEFELMPQVQKTHRHLVEKMNMFIQQSKRNGYLEELERMYVKKGDFK